MLEVIEKDDIDYYYNYMTELCFFMFFNKEKTLSIRRFEEFHSKYQKDYSSYYTYKTVLKSLKNAKVLQVNGNAKVRYQYIYYFFVAKYLVKNIDKEEIKKILSSLCSKLHYDEFSSIIMFVTHLSKSPFIITEIIANAKKIFPDHLEMLQMEKDIAPINKLIKTLPKQVIELVKADEVRQEELEERERMEINEKQNDEMDSIDYDLDADNEDMNMISKIIFSYKTMETLGQLAKKYWGSMDKENLYNITYEVYSLGLKSLKMYIKFVEDHSHLIAEVVKDIVVKKNIRDNFPMKKQIQDVSDEYLFKLCFISSMSVVKKIGSSVGYSKLK